MVTRDEFRDGIALVRDDIRGVHDRLDQLNGRTRASEQAIAVLQDRVKQETRASRRDGAIGGGVVGGIALLVEAVRHFLK